MVLHQWLIGIASAILLLVMVVVGQGEQPNLPKDSSQIQVISAQRLLPDQDIWVFLVRRTHNAQNTADLTSHDSNRKKVRHMLEKFERKVNRRLPQAEHRINEIVHNAESKINLQYDQAERKLEHTVRRAAGMDPSDPVWQLVYGTIPNAENAVNRAVHDAQVKINRNIRRTEVAVNGIVQDAEQRANAATGGRSVDAQKIKRVFSEAENKFSRRLKQSVSQLLGYIASGNKVVDANIALVESAVKRELPAVSDKVNADIKESSIEIDDSIDQGKKGVRKTMDGAVNHWHKDLMRLNRSLDKLKEK